LARTVAEAEGIVETAALVGAQVAVGHVVRYFPEYAAARQAVIEGGLGRVQTARLQRLNAGPADSGAWYADFARSGGVLLDMAIHDIDWCLWTFGPAERVYCRVAGTPGREVASITVRHRSGAIAYIDSSWREAGFSTALEITGTEGLYQVGGSGAAGFSALHGDLSPRSYLPPSADMPIVDDPYVLELAAAIQWFRGGAAPLASLAEACEAMRVVEAAQLSLSTGQPTNLGWVA
jgi:predicted dehydrogenase